LIWDNIDRNMGLSICLISVVVFRHCENYIGVDEGRVVGIEGDAVANRLLGILEKTGDSARNIAELGIGTNPEARLGVTMRETKKSWGTAHIALGDSKSLGGKVESPLHMDMIFREPTLAVDGLAVLKEGQVSL